MLVVAATSSTLACRTTGAVGLVEAHSSDSCSAAAHSLGCRIAVALEEAHTAGYILHFAALCNLGLGVNCNSRRPGRGELRPCLAIKISEIDLQTREVERVVNPLLEKSSERMKRTTDTA